MSGLKTPEQAKKDLRDHGISISEWARNNGFSASTVYYVINGKRPALYGESHKVAVALGIKKKAS